MTRVRMITETQAGAIRALYGVLGRPCPELIELTHEQAGDRIMQLRNQARGGYDATTGRCDGVKS